MADNANFDALARALLDIQARTKDLSDNLRQLNTAGIAGKSDGALAKELRQEIVAGIASVFAARGAGGSGMNITIQNNSSTSVSARQVDDGFDQKSLEITIDQMVANSLLRGRETTGVLRSLFNLVPVLMGR